MNPFARYADCLNCGNELISIHELTFRTPRKVVCDYCGQAYPGLASKVRKTKVTVNLVFAALALLVWSIAQSFSGFTGALFALFPLFIIYVFTLAAMIGKTAAFPKK